MKHAYSRLRNEAERKKREAADDDTGSTSEGNLSVLGEDEDPDHEAANAPKIRRKKKATNATKKPKRRARKAVAEEPASEADA